MGQWRSRPDASTRVLSEAYDTALLDLDGVVYSGPEAVPYAVEALEAARAGGCTSRTSPTTRCAPRGGRRAPDGAGVPASAGDVVTSAQAVARLIAEQVPPGSRVLVVGGEGLRVALRERGLVPVESADDDPAAVVQYGGPDLPWGGSRRRRTRWRAGCRGSRPTRT